MIVSGVIISGAIATAVAASNIPTAYQEITDYLRRYSKQNKDDLESLRRHYKKSKCNVFKLNGFSLEDAESLQTAGTSYSAEVNSDVPIYLRMGVDNRFPAMYDPNSSKTIKPCTDSTIWIDKLFSGLYNTHIRNALAEICEEQRLRKETWFNGDFDYDPVNLMLEEIKSWFLQLSACQHEPRVILPSIKARIAYLNNIIFDSELFLKARWYHKTRLSQLKCALNRINETLENEILPNVKSIISQLSAREQLGELQNSLSASVYQVIRYMYYAFRNNETTKNFDTSQIKNPTSDSYIKKENNLLEGLLRELLSTPLVSAVVTLLCENTTVSAFDEEFQLQFIHPETKNPCLPAITKYIPNIPENSILADIVSSSSSIGIVDILVGKTDIIERMLAFVEQLSLVHGIIKQLYALSADGGNMLVYRAGASTLLPLISQIRGFLKKESSFFHELHEKLNRDCLKLIIEESCTDNQWVKMFGYARDAYETATTEINGSETLLSEIKESIDYASSNDYTREVKNRIERLNGLIHVFQSRSPDETPELSSTSEIKSLPSAAGLFFNQENLRNSTHDLPEMLDKEFQEFLEIFEIENLPTEQLEAVIDSYRSSFYDIRLEVEYAHFLVASDELSNKVEAVWILKKAIDIFNTSNHSEVYLKAKTLWLSTRFSLSDISIEEAQEELEQLVSDYCDKLHRDVPEPLINLRNAIVARKTAEFSLQY